MNVDGQHYRTIWQTTAGHVCIIDQQKLPHQFEIIQLTDLESAAIAIETMQVRGAPCIGATAAYGVALAMREENTDDALNEAVNRLGQTRPTAVNLHWALDQMQTALKPLSAPDRAAAAFTLAGKICDEDIENCRRIGEYGVNLIEDIARQKGRVNILTHCNAGWLACVDWGTALAPIYMAQAREIDLHVWVDETRPRNQGAALTAWELGQQGIPHTIVTDNAGGHLMQQGLVDLCFVGSDRTTRTGDVANKIGTYLKALAAFDNDIPFYVALPASTIDWNLRFGSEVPIEERSAEEVTHMTGQTATGSIEKIRIAAPNSDATNFGFDITPARLVTGLITERGVTEASEAGLLQLYPERADDNV